MSFNILKQTKQNKKVAALFFKKNKHVCTLFTGNKTFLKQRKAVFFLRQYFYHLWLNHFNVKLNGVVLLSPTWQTVLRF